MREINLEQLAAPFPAGDIEWRVAHTDVGRNGRYCRVVPFITARAIQQRLDDVCGLENWQVTEPILMQHEKRCAVKIGISICVNGNWITKWDVADMAQSDGFPPFKSAASGAIKRAACHLGIGRYLYYIEECFADVVEEKPAEPGWNFASVSQKKGGGYYWWKTPSLPGWALPKEAEPEVSVAEVSAVVAAWREKFAADVKDPKDRQEGFRGFVEGVTGSFPIADHKCWTRDALERIAARIADTTDPNGVSSDVPFEE